MSNCSPQKISSNSMVDENKVTKENEGAMMNELKCEKSSSTPQPQTQTDEVLTTVSSNVFAGSNNTFSANIGFKKSNSLNLGNPVGMNLSGSNTTTNAGSTFGSNLGNNSKKENEKKAWRKRI